MTDSQIFTKRANTLKYIFLLALIGFSLMNLYSLGLAIWEMSPWSQESTYTVSFITNQYGNRIATHIDNNNDFSPYIQITQNLMKPTDDFVYSTSQTVANISLISIIVRLPLILALWMTYQIFKELSTSRTPFTSLLFDRIRRLGKVLILYGVLGNLAFSILASIFVTGVLYCINPLNVYMILLGFVLYIVSEILEYGFGLQNEVDEML